MTGGGNSLAGGGRPYRDIVAPGRVAGKRTYANGRIVMAAGVTAKRAGADGGVVGVGIVAKRTRTDGCVKAAIEAVVNRKEGTGADSRVNLTGGVVEESIRSDGGVGVAANVVGKRERSCGRVLLGGVVMDERGSSNGRVFNASRVAKALPSLPRCLNLRCSVSGFQRRPLC